MPPLDPEARREMSPSQLAAALNAMPTNRGWPPSRMELALHALGLREAEVEQLRAERDALHAQVEAVRALHSPAEGWEREWKDPDEALRAGWPRCVGCTTSASTNTLATCPTLAALDALAASREGGPPPTSSPPRLAEGVNGTT